MPETDLLQQYHQTEPARDVVRLKQAYYLLTYLYPVGFHLTFRANGVETTHVFAKSYPHTYLADSDIKNKTTPDFVKNEPNLSRDPSAHSYHYGQDLNDKLVALTAEVVKGATGQVEIFCDAQTPNLRSVPILYNALGNLAAHQPQKARDARTYEEMRNILSEYGVTFTVTENTDRNTHMGDLEHRFGTATARQSATGGATPAA